jgi:hypothetical protein
MKKVCLVVASKITYWRRFSNIVKKKWKIRLR